MHAPDVGLTPATLLAAAQVPAKVLTRAHRQCRGAPHGRAHLRRAARHRHGRAQPARGRPRGARRCTPRRCWPRAPPQPQASKVFPFKPRERVVTRIDQRRSARRESAAQASAAGHAPLRPPRHAGARACTARGACRRRRCADDRRVSRAPMLLRCAGPPPTAAASLRAPAAGLTERLDRMLARWRRPGRQTEHEHEAPAPDARSLRRAAGGASI